MKKGVGSPSPRNKAKIIPRTLVENAVCGGIFCFWSGELYRQNITENAEQGRQYHCRDGQNGEPNRL